jgi:hypothetical protein
MAVTATPIYPQTIKNWNVQIALADASNLKTLVTGGTNGSKIESLFATSTETANTRDLQFVLTVSGTDYILDTINVPVNAGFTNNVAPLNILNSTTRFLWASYDAAGNRYLYIASGAVLKVKSLTTLASGKTIQVNASGADF